MVTLYQGGVYHLYRYKRYDDVRLVFAPEQQIAFYGGDPDNFEYPRFDLDVCFFRAYENGQPAKIEHFLKWNPKGPSGWRIDLRQRTSRPHRSAADHDELAETRDVEIPYLLNMFNRREVFLERSPSAVLKMRAACSEDIRRRRRTTANATTVIVAALLDPEIWSAIEQREQKLRDAMSANAEFKGTLAAFDRIKKAAGRNGQDSAGL